ncbi:SipW-dependent-type signal peptide-containing protein [Saliphagus infecundisoli]|uniref:SipW-dependent-type signal peptide-containing protein n=1 Tax=Saliphagus infecundisoli TaxID=1849069 RepID=A0ABD5QFZ6_9EURY|nr:SipW-dependent-type signal peptide-containing protein [Saliphagus infecundisoli]
MSEKDFEISRRKALAGLGVVGVASAGAGLGTTAYFNDEEEFDDNTITAGNFGLTVDPYGLAVDQGEHLEVDWNTDSGQMEDGVFAGGEIFIDDIKPGDYFKFCWEVTVHHNPGYVLVRADNVKDLDGSETDANLSDDDLHDTEDLATLGETARAEVKIYKPGGHSEGTLSIVPYDSLDILLDSLKEGLVISTSQEDPLSIGPDSASYESVIVCVYIWVGAKAGDPGDIGNEIQGAKLSANLEFYAEQARHNGDSFPSGSPGSE